MFEYLVYFILPLTFIVFGLIGNILGLITLGKGMSHNLDRKIGPIYMYQFIFLIDSMLLISYINFYLDKIHSIGPFLFSNYSCKLLIYLNISICSLSSFILIYILIESYLSIKYPVESNLLRKKKPQFIYLIIILIVNLIYFSPFLLHYNLIQVQSSSSVNNTRSTITCSIEPNEKHKIELITFINRIFLPFIIILFFSTILIYKICAVKRRMTISYTERQRNHFKKDIHLSIISILFNIFQYSFNFPLIIVYFNFNDEQSVIYFFLFRYLPFKLCF